MTPVFFLYSYFLVSLTTAGDRIHYDRLYEALQGENIANIVSISIKYVSGAEPLPALLFWVGSNLGWDKNLFVSVLNTIFLYSVLSLCIKYRVKILPTFLILTNFYVIVLLTSAERLKIAYMLLVWTALAPKKSSIVFMGLTPFAHLQSFIFLPGLFVSSLFKSGTGFSLSLRIKRSGFIFGCAACFVVLISSLFLFDAAYSKARVYFSDNFLWSDMLKFFALCIFSVGVASNKKSMFFGLLAFLPPLVFFGGSRINMIIITFVIYRLLVDKKLQHSLSILFLSYLTYKSVSHVNNIFLYGDGFINKI